MRLSLYRFLLVPSSDRGGRQGTMLTTGLRFHPEYEKISRSQPFLRNNPLRLNQIKGFREEMFWCSSRGIWLTNWKPTSDESGKPWQWHLNSILWKRPRTPLCSEEGSQVEFWGSDYFLEIHWLERDTVLNFNEKKNNSLPWLYVMCDGR